MSGDEWRPAIGAEFSTRDGQRWSVSASYEHGIVATRADLAGGAVNPLDLLQISRAEYEALAGE